MPTCVVQCLFITHLLWWKDRKYGKKNSLGVNRLLGRGGSGQRRRRPRPGLDDYLGLREYRDGDPRRSIMWKRWIDERTPAVVQRAESAGEAELASQLRELQVEVG